MKVGIKIHDTAIIDKGAVIGHGTKIWHWAHICSGTKIGKHVSIGQNVFIGNKTLIGNNCKIQNNVSIYDNVTLEDYVFCGPSVVFTNVYNPRAMVERKKEYKNTLVKKGTTLGANCTIVCGVTIGDFSFVAAGSVVTKNVKPYALMAGNPASQKGWMSEYGLRIPLPLEGKGDYFCDNEKKHYRLSDKELRKV
mgnify:CR=1 FL=1